MRLLVLGGTQFLSREVAAEAARRGHEVTCANRGQSGTVPPGAQQVLWDRTEPAPDELTAVAFDAVVDVARQPSQVRRALAAFPDAHWVFVSTISVYADHGDPGGPEQGPLLEPITEDLDPLESPEVYGGMKVACEDLVRARAGSAAVVRPGLIVGPGDPSGRFAYWARRSVTAGEVLAPGHPDDLVQVIDVRDLAAWLVTLTEERATGTWDGIGEPVRIEDLLHACLPAASLVWVDQAFLADQGVEPWAGSDGIPLWLPRPAYDGMPAHDAQPARDAGLELRPVADTVRDTHAWLEGDPAARIDGITLEREAELLAHWREK